MHRRLLLALAPALALSSAALAQAPGGPPDRPPMRHGAPSAEMKAMHEAMMKQHIEDLKTVLRLRPDQEAALQAFVAAHHPPEGDGMPGMKGGPRPPEALTTPQRLDRMAKREAEMATRHEQMRQALSKFYAALSPDQQKVFDALMRLKGPGHMGGHMGGMMGGGPRRMMMMRHGGPGDGPMPGPMPGNEPG
jgi:hypothetical protein